MRGRFDSDMAQSLAPTPYPMKSPKKIVTLVVLALFAAGVTFAADEKKDAKDANKEAKCCAKAEKAGKTCDHECCVAAAKEGKNCEKCGGSGKIEKKEVKKEEKK